MPFRACSMALPNLSPKLPHLPPTIFTTMTQMARAYGAVNLGQGFPDFPMDGGLTEAVCRAMQEGHNQYAHTFGNPALREVLSQKIHSLYGLLLSSETEITITPGGTYAISNAITALIRPGDEVILFEPAFDSYFPNIEIMGAKPVPIALRFPGYTIPWDEVAAACTARTRMIIINSPHNPTGTLLTEDDLNRLAEITRGTDILVLSDEVYEHLVFDGLRHHSVLAHPELQQRSLAAYSLGKVFHCTGWKIGYMAAPAYLTREFRNHHQFNVFSVNAPMQQGLAEFLTEPARYLRLGSFFETRRDRFRAGIRDLGWTLLPAQGSYFQCVQFPLAWGNDSGEVAARLVKEAGVASIPVSAFYHDRTDHRVLRFCFAKSEQTLDEAVVRLQEKLPFTQN